jgi:hypothetical protein
MEAYYNALAQQDAELATRAQQAGMEQTRFGAGLFGTGADLLRGVYQGQIGALAPFEAYLGQAKGLESLGQQPLALGIDIGSKGQSGAAAQAMLSGGMSAARALEAANAYNPFADFLTGFSRSPALARGVGSIFGGTAPMSGFGAGGYGAGVNPFSGEYMGSLEF